ncbi:MAG: hypothetical protein WDN49_23955 [Acetobacteraceae bacterium]
MEYKAYSCARPIHNAIDCALNVRREMQEPTTRIRAMQMRRHPDWAHYHLNRHPKTYHEAQVSLPYSVAVALIEGAALLPQYQDEKLTDPEILRLSEMLQIEVDPSLPRGVTCVLAVEMESGAQFTSQVDHPRGSIANPMTPEEMARKVHMLADPVLGEPGVAKVIEACDAIESLPTITALTSLLERSA